MKIFRDGNFREVKNRKTQALIAAIIVIMILALLGGVVMRFISADLEITRRVLNSERSLYLSESGVEWTSMWLSDNFNCDFNGVGPINNETVLHSLNYGQYEVHCLCDEPQCGGEITITSTGYIPNKINYEEMREVEFKVSQGGFANSGHVKDILDWSKWHSGSYINGNVQVLVSETETTKGFEGTDVNTIFNNKPDDFSSTPTIIPAGSGTRTAGVGTYPVINMDFYKGKAVGYGRWENYTAKTTVANPSSEGSNLRVVPIHFFDDCEKQVVRNLTHGTWSDSDWAVITGVVANGKQANLDRVIGDTWDNDTIRIVRRFSKDVPGELNTKQLWYIDGSDVLIDVRTDTANFNKTSLMATGDIVIVGSEELKMSAYVDTSAHETYPNIATQDGNIYFRNEPSATGGGDIENKKANNRGFDGLIYTENGRVDIQYINGIAIMGKEVYLDGRVKLNYISKYIETTEGFSGDVGILSWQEK